MKQFVRQKIKSANYYFSLPFKKLNFYLEFFKRVNDMRTFYFLIHSKQISSNKELFSLCVKQLNDKKVFLRNNHADASVFFDVFHNGFHLPEISLPANANILDLG